MGLCEFNDRAVALLSRPIVVAGWWVGSAAAAAWTVIEPGMIAGTLTLSLLALAYSSAIYERQIRNELVDRERDVTLHKKVDALITATPGADDALAGSEPDPAD